jgi:hypothetical protein
MWGIRIVLPQSLAQLLVLPTAGLLVRPFIIAHD